VSRWGASVVLLMLWAVPAAEAGEAAAATTGATQPAPRVGAPDLTLPPLPSVEIEAPPVRATELPIDRRELKVRARPAPAPALRANEAEAEDGPAVRPGKLAPAPAPLPGPLQKSRTVAPRTGSPDLQVNVDDRTSIGVFGEAGQIQREDIRTNTVRQTRDVGAGVTLQYKFGQ